jgi:methionine synthase II (cobalamin-independent)
LAVNKYKEGETAKFERDLKDAIDELTTKQQNIKVDTGVSRLKVQRTGD